MTNDKVRITVDGEPVTREVTLEQVRAYLTRKGWLLEPEPKNKSYRSEMWSLRGKGSFCLLWHANAGNRMILVISDIERRHPAEVLREIAGDARQPWTWEGEVSSLPGRRVGVRVERDVIYMLSRDNGSAPSEPRDEADVLAEALRAAVGRQPRGKKPAETRADEIEAEAAKRACPLTFYDAVRSSWETKEYASRTDEPTKEQVITDAAAWLVVAQRMLAREAAGR